ALNVPSGLRSGPVAAGAGSGVASAGNSAGGGCASALAAGAGVCSASAICSALSCVLDTGKPSFEALSLHRPSQKPEGQKAHGRHSPRSALVSESLENTARVFLSPCRERVSRGRRRFGSYPRRVPSRSPFLARCAFLDDRKLFHLRRRHRAT